MTPNRLTLIATLSSFLLLPLACTPIQINTDNQPVFATQSSSDSSTLTGVAAEVDAIAQKITVRIDSTNNGNGSGVIIAKEGNTYYVLTAAHVVQNEDRYKIATDDEREYEINNVTILKGADLAVVTFTSNQTYPIATIAEYNLGVDDEEWVFISGYPVVKESSQTPPKRRLTAGLLFSKEFGSLGAKDVYSLAESSGYELVYTNISQGGMSGGAVLDNRGRLIGIHAAAEGEVIIEESGNVSEIFLGRSLGVSIRTFLELSKINSDSLQIQTTAPLTLNESQITAIRKSLFQVETPPKDASEFEWLNYGNQLWRIQRYQEATAAFDEAIALKPDLYQAYYGKGLALQARDKNQEAFASFEKVTEINPKFYEAWRERAKNLYLLQKYPEALVDIDKAIALQPEDFALYWWRSGILVYLGRFPEANVAASKAVELNPDSVYAYTFRGSTYNFLGEQEKAIADLDRALQINPKSTLTYVMRGNAYLVLEKYDLALADFDRALQMDSNSARAYEGRSLANIGLGKLTDALADSNRLVELEPESADVYNSRGGIYERLGDKNKALADYTKAIELDPNSFSAYYSRVNLYNTLQQYDKAIADCNKALEIVPENGAVLSVQLPNQSQFSGLKIEQVYKYIIYANRGIAYAGLEKYQNAIADFSEAIKLNSNSAPVYFFRGTAYFSLQDYQNAIADFTKVIELKPDDADAYKSRGNAYLKLGQYGRAIADFGRAAIIKRGEN